MLCMFADASRLPDKIGPTRSARHYFVEIAEGFDSIFVHFGGSPQGYNALDAAKNHIGHPAVEKLPIHQPKNRYNTNANYCVLPIKQPLLVRLMDNKVQHQDNKQTDPCRS